MGGLLITGTDTGVGATRATSWLTRCRTVVDPGARRRLPVLVGLRDQRVLREARLGC